jgi:beta-RFAP synthase
MISVRTASRLHLGLLSLPTLAAGTVPRARCFGGVGLMVRDPGLCLRVRPAAAWSAEGPLAERALTVAVRFNQALAAEGIASPPPQHLLLERAAPEHVGLGTGTQLGLAVARALATAAHLDSWSAADLARRVGRGARSALGVHGFAQGGFLVEAGKSDSAALAPLVARLAFPTEWRIILVLPGGAQGLHGLAETQAFQHLAQQPLAPILTERLCRLVLLGLLPALAEADLPAFGEALYAFNQLVGEAFRPIQGGTYAHPQSAAVVAFVRQHGVAGVGQSSWGPALLAVAADEDQGEDLAGRLRRRFRLAQGEVQVTPAVNHGATTKVET